MIIFLLLVATWYSWSKRTKKKGQLLFRNLDGDVFSQVQRMKAPVLAAASFVPPRSRAGSTARNTANGVRSRAVVVCILRPGRSCSPLTLFKKGEKGTQRRSALAGAEGHGIDTAKVALRFFYMTEHITSAEGDRGHSFNHCSIAKRLSEVRCSGAFSPIFTELPQWVYVDPEMLRRMLGSEY
jgi:hypothetical protein